MAPTPWSRHAVFTLTAALLCGANQSRAQTGGALTAFADSLERANFSGTFVIADTQRVLFSRTFGLADARTGRRITPTDTWRWASVSKQITAALVLREVQAGRIALDTPTVRYLPTFGGVDRARITVRQLLQHTSGLPNPEQGAKDSDGMPRVYRVRTGVVGDAAFANTCGGAVAAAPGTQFDYNNCDYLVLGALLHRVTGKGPTQLVRATFGIDVTQPETVRGYIAADTLEPSFNVETYGSAGAMRGTVESLVRVDRLLLGNLRSPATRAEMWSGEPRFGFAALGAWSFDASLRSCPSPVAIVERRGSIQGIQVRNVLLPQRGLIVVLFTNRGDFDFGEVWQGNGVLFDALSAAACGGPPNFKGVSRGQFQGVRVVD